MLCQLCGFLLMFIFGGSMMFVGLILSAFGTGGSSATMYSFIADSVDYGEYKYGVRTDGIAYSLNTSVQKLAQACASLILGVLLSVGGFDPAAMVQTDSAIFAVKMAFCGVPIIIAVINGICSILMDVEKKYPDMPERLAAIRAGKSEE